MKEIIAFRTFDGGLFSDSERALKHEETELFNFAGAIIDTLSKTLVPTKMANKENAAHLLIRDKSCRKNMRELLDALDCGAMSTIDLKEGE